MPSIGANPLYTPVTAGLQIVAGRSGYIHSVLLTAGSAAATATLYNNTSASGNPIAVLAAGIGTSVYPDLDGLPFNGLGLFVVVTGTGATFNIYLE